MEACQAKGAAVTLGKLVCASYVLQHGHLVMIVHFQRVPVSPWQHAALLRVLGIDSTAGFAAALSLINPVTGHCHGHHSVAAGQGRTLSAIFMQSLRSFCWACVRCHVCSVIYAVRIHSMFASPCPTVLMQLGMKTGERFYPNGGGPNYQQSTLASFLALFTMLLYLG